MKRTRTTLALLAAVSTSFAGCEGLHWANMAVLGVTFGLFFGTLQLGKRPADPGAARTAPSVAPRAK